MKKFFSITICILAAFLFLSSSAWAITYTIYDNINYFPGYGNASDNNTDTIGTPKVGTMFINVDDTSREIQTIKIEVVSRRVWDTLFINTDFTWNDPNDITDWTGWDQWDYMIRDTNNEDGELTWVASGEDSQNLVGGLYSVSSGYTYTTVKITSGREDHPNGIKDDGYLSLVQSGDFSDWTNNVLTYDLAALNIKVGSHFAIGYAPWCANDVTGGIAPVPEPATIILMGFGLIGLAGTARKKFIK